MRNASSRFKAAHGAQFCVICRTSEVRARLAPYIERRQTSRRRYALQLAGSSTQIHHRPADVYQQYESRQGTLRHSQTV